MSARFTPAIGFGIIVAILATGFIYWGYNSNRFRR